jgi:hypothetical protein
MVLAVPVKIRVYTNKGQCRNQGESVEEEKARRHRGSTLTHVKQPE